ncbi:latent-transforming growth factor beta-binding protein 4-like isoform X1 [Bombyx mandarina]|uniref:Latent-transforming growth factor beta-binding protein 4-like isoform X1 n=1 Tax=Bombyx mandarina TaxID=7092 RepID=A0A6J2J8C1_BOMMA|nr:latent-transforming growth factor beta-binding protein 4-like isoform X1 [Bombyx mandarina]
MKFIVIFTFLFSTVNALSSEETLAVTDSCCTHAEGAALLSTDCSAIQPPEDIDAEQLPTCITALKACCEKQHKEKDECSAGVKLASSKRCNSIATNIGQACCEECSIGRTIGKTQGLEGCGKPVNEEYNSPSTILRKKAFHQCCSTAANEPETTEKVETTTLPSTTTSTAKPKVKCTKDSCAQICEVEQETIRCSCRDGFRLHSDKKSCKDVNECAEADDDICTEEGFVCHNTPGSYKCVPLKPTTKRDVGSNCPPGFKKNVLNQVCDDINECQLPRPPCPKYLCENTIGGYKCAGKPGKPVIESAPGAPEVTTPVAPVRNEICPPGFRAGPDDECIDIDECEESLDDCQRLSQHCINTHGSFFCQDHVSKRCAPGFKVNTSTGICEDIDECEESTEVCKRTEICVNLPGAYNCKSKISSLPKLAKTKCQEGMRLRPGGTVCEDIDECREGTHLCDEFQNCINTYGAHECRCKNGFELDSLLESCVDIDECALKLDNCGPRLHCLNVLGSFTCTYRQPSTTSTTPVPPLYEYEYYDSEDDNETAPEIAATTSTTRPTYPTQRTTTSTQRTTTSTQRTTTSTQRTTTSTPRTTTSTQRTTTSTTKPTTLTTRRSRPYYPYYDRPRYTTSTKRPSYPYNRRPSTPSRVEPTTPKKPEVTSSTEISRRPDYSPSRSDYTPRRPEITTPIKPETTTEALRRPTHNPSRADNSRRPSPFRPGYVTGVTRPKDPITIEKEREDDGGIELDTNTIPKETWTNVIGRDKPEATDTPAFDPNEVHCLNGYEKDFFGNCVDINECERSHICSNLEDCINKAGGYRCDCIAGFKRNQQGWCIPIPPPTTTSTTSTTTSTTTPRTISVSLPEWQYTPPRSRGRYPSIACELGYTYDTKYGKCVDIDECATNKATCSRNEECVNIDGGFRCVCGWRCRAENEKPTADPSLVPASPISPIAPHPPPPSYSPSEPRYPDNTNVITVGAQYGQRGPWSLRPSFTRFSDRGAVVSSCPWGYKVTQDKRCVDIDECAKNTSECGPLQRCENFYGGYSCQCPAGHRLVGQNGCDDIDECRHGNPCSSYSRCKNTVGSYRCECDEGFRNAASNDKVCVDVDECSESPNVCQHGCANTWGGYRCYCKRGYRVGNDNRTCVDVNECEEWTSVRIRGKLCAGECVNEPGSYRCACPAGYRLSEDNRSCIDIDECETGEAPCARTSDSGNVCQNTRGSYHCHKIECPTGYRLESKHRCTRIQRTCLVSDWSCLQLPSTYSYHFITFVANIFLPSGSVDLFTMHGPSWQDSVVSFEMRMISVQASHGVQPTDLRCFDMRPSGNICVVSLLCSLGGPQVAELELTMSLYQRSQFAGSAVARLVVIVSEYEY